MYNRGNRKSLFDSIIVFFFIPIYFTTRGIYNSGKIDQRLVLPIIVLGFILVFLKNFFRSTGIIKTKQNKLLVLISTLSFYFIIIGLLGILFKGSFTVFINTFQLLSGYIGIYLAKYFYEKGYRATDVFEKVSDVFMIILVLNILDNIINKGIIGAFTSRITPETPFGLIYQNKIYYPYIVSLVTLYDLPNRINKNKNRAIIRYILILIYILLHQVRGAILSLFFGLLLFVKSQNKFSNKFKTLFTFFISGLIVVFFLPKEVILGRFNVGESNISLISGRENVWVKYILSLKGNPFYLLFGTFSGYSSATSLSSLTDDIRLSYHNQYLEWISNYGIVGLLFIFYIIYLAFRKNNLNIKILKLKNSSEITKYKYWNLLFVLHLLVDLNINVPMRVTNPAIYYWFFWTYSFYDLERHVEEII